MSETGSAPRQLVVLMDDLCLYHLWRRDLFYVSVLSFLAFHSYIGRKISFPNIFKAKISGIVKWPTQSLVEVWGEEQGDQRYQPPLDAQTFHTSAFDCTHMFYFVSFYC